MSTISETILIEEVTHPNENLDIPPHPTDKISDENLEWRTPDALHRSINEMTPAMSAVPPHHRSAPQNMYKLNYTASPAQNKSGNLNRSFLDQGQPADSNL